MEKIPFSEVEKQCLEIILCILEERKAVKLQRVTKEEACDELWNNHISDFIGQFQDCGLSVD